MTKNEISIANVEITNYCIHHCKKCIHGNKINNFRECGFMLIKNWEYILTSLKEYEVKYIGFGGTGETLLHPQFFAFLDKMKEILPDTTFGFHTNGILLNKKKMIDLCSYNINDIEISLDAMTNDTYQRVHGTNSQIGQVFSLIDDLLDLLSSGYKFRLGISYVIQPENICEVFKFLAYYKTISKIAFAQLNLICDKFGYSCESINNYYQELSNVLPEINKYCKENLINIKVPSLNVKYGSINLDESASISCSFPLQVYPNITWNGEVFPCVWLYNDKYSLGNIFIDSFENVVFGEKYIKIMSTIKNDMYFHCCKNCCPIGTNFKKINDQKFAVGDYYE